MAGGVVGCRRVAVTLFCAATLAIVSAAQAGPGISTEFGFQGQIKKDGVPFTGDCDFTFSLWNAVAAGSQIGSSQVVPVHPVVNGLFTVALDFGAGPFNHDDRWLQVQASCPPGGPLTLLTPRQPIRSTPYALQTRGIFVDDAGNVQLSGNLRLTDPLDSIIFPATNAANNPMMFMFQSGTGNQDRMVIAHSPAFPTWGLQYRDDVDHFDFLGSGQPVMTVNLNNRRVGILTQTPRQHLSIGNDLDIYSGGVAGVLSRPSIRGSGADNLVLNAYDAGALYLNHDSGTGGIRFHNGTSGGEVARITAEGRMGIGTTNPNVPLHVIQDASTGSGIFSSGTIVASKGGGTTGPGMRVSRFSSPPLFFSTHMEIDGAALNTYGTFVGTSATMSLNTSSEGNVVMVNGGGNVGIGTTAPSLRLSIVDAGVGLNRPTTNSLGLYTDGTERMRINSVGNVGVGTTGPNVRFHVNGPSGEHAFRVQVNGATKLLVASNGGVSVGTNQQTPPVNGLWVQGTTRTAVLEIAGADLAEVFPFSEAVEPGMVVEIDADNPGKLRLSRSAYNRRVAGVIAGANDFASGVILGRDTGNQHGAPVALSGRVYVFCDATDEAIEPGDLLTTSDVPGHAMKVNDHQRATGAILGKAMTGLARGESGMVLTLVTLH